MGRVGSPRRIHPDHSRQAIPHTVGKLRVRSGPNRGDVRLDLLAGNLNRKKVRQMDEKKKFIELLDNLIPIVASIPDRTENGEAWGLAEEAYWAIYQAMKAMKDPERKEDHMKRAMVRLKSATEIIEGKYREEGA